MNHHLIDIAWDWGCRCFGSSHMRNWRVRSLRQIEESVELAQALEVPKAKVLEVIEQVYSRPHGHTYQEAGGTLVTTLMLLRSLKLDPETVFTDEIKRCLAKTPEHFTERNKQKVDV